MQLAPILPALISALGTLSGALGGIALTSGLESRRQRLAAASAAASEQAASRDQARTDLIAAVTGLRVNVELACARHWRDMNVRLAAIGEQAATAGVRASRVAILAPGQAEADAALALGRCASGLSAWTAKAASLGDFEGANPQFVAGQIMEPPDFRELDQFLAVFLRLISPS